MKRVLAAITAAFLCSGGGAAFAPPGVDQALVESDAMPPKLSAFGLFRGNDPKRDPASPRDRQRAEQAEPPARGQRGRVDQRQPHLEAQPSAIAPAEIGPRAGSCRTLA